MIFKDELEILEHYWLTDNWKTGEEIHKLGFLYEDRRRAAVYLSELEFKGYISLKTKIWKLSTFLALTEKGKEYIREHNFIIERWRGEILGSTVRFVYEDQTDETLKTLNSLKDKRYVEVKEKNDTYEDLALSEKGYLYCCKED